MMESRTKSRVLKLVVFLQYTLNVDTSRLPGPLKTPRDPFGGAMVTSVLMATTST